MFDFKGVSMHQFSSSVIELARSVISDASSFYPGTLGEMVLVNVPSFLPIVWRLVRTSVGEETMGKIRMYGGGEEMKRALGEMGCEAILMEGEGNGIDGIKRGGDGGGLPFGGFNGKALEMHLDMDMDMDMGSKEFNNIEDETDVAVLLREAKDRLQGGGQNFRNRDRVRNTQKERERERRASATATTMPEVTRQGGHPMQR